MIKWRCCPRSVQFQGLSSVEVMVRYSAQISEGIIQQLGKVLLELNSVQTSIKGGSVQVKVLSKSRSVQSCPFKTSRLGLAKSSPINQLLIGIEHCELACLNSVWNLG
ncbi:hypothetical protein Bca4012_064490 [Brassica carinata]